MNTLRSIPKRAIITIGAIVAASIVLVGLIQSYQTLTVSFNPTHGTLKLEGTSLKTPIMLETERELILKKGKYTIIVSGETAEPQHIPLELGNTPLQKTIAIGLSKKQLDTQLKNEHTTLTKSIAAEYPTVFSLYKIERERLYDRGDYYGAILTYKGSDADNRDSIRLVMQKKSGAWKLAGKPSILLSVFQSPDIPDKILRDINKPSILPATPTSPAIIPK